MALTATKERRVEQLRRNMASISSSRGRGKQRLAVPRNATADQRFIATALEYQRAAKAYLAASDAHRQFAATHDFSDPGHAEFQDRTVDARRTLISAEERFVGAQIDLLGFAP